MAIPEDDTPEVGDCYDVDTGEYLGRLDLEDSDGKFTGLPAQIEVFCAGYWYIFKPDARYKHEEDMGREEQKTATLNEELRTVERIVAEEAPKPITDEDLLNGPKT